MNHLSRTPASGGDAGPRRFIVNFIAKRGEEPEVRSCEINSSFFRNRTSFPQTVAVNEIFIEGVAQAIQDCLGKLSGHSEIVSLPSFFLEIPGLILASANVMSSETSDGSVSIILRFKFVLGGVNHAFRRDIGFNEFVGDQNAHLSASVLADISMPLLNFCSAAELGVLDSENSLGVFVEKLKERAIEIKFQIELVKRFVEHNKADPSTRDLYSILEQDKTLLSKLN